MAEHRPSGSETRPPYAPRSSRFGSEPPSVEDDVDVWRYATLELNARNDDEEEAAAAAAAGRGKLMNVRYKETCPSVRSFASRQPTGHADRKIQLRKLICTTLTATTTRQH